MHQDHTQSPEPDPLPEPGGYLHEETRPVWTPEPWGLWQTAGLSLVIALVYALVSILVASGYVIVQGQEALLEDPETMARSLQYNGALLTVTTLMNTFFCMALMLFFAWIPRYITIREYFSLNWPGWKPVLKGVLVIILFAVATDAFGSLAGKRVLPEFTIETYKSAGSLPLYLLALVICAPLVEEFFFRGFLFIGIEKSRLGPAGAIWVTSVTWALIHIQYKALHVFIIFCIGMILGHFRRQYQSLYPCLAMHGLQNLIAISQAGIFLGAGA